MCVLCYEFADEGHWADAVVPEATAPDELGGRARYRRRRILAEVLRPYGLTVSDPGAGRHVVVSNRKGASEVVAGLPAIWQAAQRLSGRRVDVLDPALLDALTPSGVEGQPQ